MLWDEENLTKSRKEAQRRRIKNRIVVGRHLAFTRVRCRFSKIYVANKLEIQVSLLSKYERGVLALPVEIALDLLWLYSATKEEVAETIQKLKLISERKIND